MIQFIQNVTDFINTIVKGINNVIAFIPKSIAYLNDCVAALPTFLIPVASISIAILVFNRITKSL